jgi:beta-glucanase (GH16 family)
MGVLVCCISLTGYFMIIPSKAPAAAGWIDYYKIDFKKHTPQNQALYDQQDDTLWKHEIGFINMKDTGYCRIENVVVEDGMLKILGKKEWVANANYISGAADPFKSKKFAHYSAGSIIFGPPFRYGKVEIVARTPKGLGISPQIWLFGPDEQQYGYGEIDIMEYFGNLDLHTAYSTLHYGPSWRRLEHKFQKTVIPDFEETWHAYRLEWLPHLIAIYIDDKLVLSEDPDIAKKGGIDPLRQPMQLRLSMSLGNKTIGPVEEAQLPAEFAIKSIHIWKLRGYE